ncbi:MAG TPA: ABC transporter permease [Puia sp.]|jgi:ABC-type antimicrobial peptide transport system permease subunit|nr:ABC transporter permease [Puia sp.]
MFPNFLKVAWRNLWRGKAFSLINLVGLAIGMASALLILMWVHNEFSFDSTYPASDRLYQGWNRGKYLHGIQCRNITPSPLGPALKTDYPEVERASRLSWDASQLFTIGDKKIDLTGAAADTDFLPMFGFPMLKGDPLTALKDPNNIVLTQKAARALFGDADAMGKTLRLDNKYDYTVTGVMKDLPNNTGFDFEYLLPWKYLVRTNQDDSDWEHNFIRNYVLVRPHTDIARLNNKIRNIYQQHVKGVNVNEAFLYPVSRLHLYSNFENGVPAGGRIETVRVFLTIAVFILLIACINFMNMSTARSERRAKEVGIRKVSGALRSSLIGQFLGESILLSAVAGGIALLLVQVCLGPFNLLTQKQLVVEYVNPIFWLSFAGFIIFTGVLAGSYPAFFLSAFRPVSVLKGYFKKAHQKELRRGLLRHAPSWFGTFVSLGSPRKALVVLQFTFAIILIVSTLIIRRQVQYAQTRETGYNKDNIVWTYLSGNVAGKYDLIKSELLDKGIALAVTKSSAPLSTSWQVNGAFWKGKNPNVHIDFNYFNEDGGIVKTAGLRLLQGRDIDTKQYPTDSTAVVLNEAAAKAMGFKDPIGQIINRGDWDVGWHVIGVVKDFVLESPFDAIKPMIILGPKANWFNLMHIRLNGAKPTAQSLAEMGDIFRRYNPEYPFEYHFIDQEYARKFNDEQTTATLTALFAGLTILISCLGLFGLAAYMAEARIKEIGVRKVLGASVTGIVTLLSGDFIRLVLIALLIAAPIAWWSMDKWLDNFDYHIAIPWWIFLAAGAIAVGIALGTVSFQAIRAALTNPARSLRSE